MSGDFNFGDCYFASCASGDFNFGDCYFLALLLRASSVYLTQNRICLLQVILGGCFSITGIKLYAMDKSKSNGEEESLVQKILISALKQP